eukprot:2082093-Prymnesium_polylepis.1
MAIHVALSTRDDQAPEILTLQTPGGPAAASGKRRGYAVRATMRVRGRVGVGMMGKETLIKHSNLGDGDIPLNSAKT